MKYIFIILLIIYSFSLEAQQNYLVDSETSFNNAIEKVEAGDTILFKNSTTAYSDLSLKFKISGTKEQPIVIKAQTNGYVFFTGNTQIEMGGEYIVVEGFTFKAGSYPDNLIGESAIIFRYSSSSDDWASNCVVKNITFDGFNQSPTEEQNKLKWIQVYGYDNEIENCSFLNKKGVGNCITIERKDVIENRTLIHHNFFAYRDPIVVNGSVLNDQDAMRLGWSGASLSDASCQVYDNFFYDWDGEVEIISNKSCRNKYYNNTFRKCVGTLTLRHGTHCEVYNNFFFGENISKSGGVRIIDSDHKVYNNYFQDLNSGGSKIVGAINLFKGDQDFLDGTLSSYAPNEDNLVAHNTIVNCDKGIWIGPDDSGREFAPKNMSIYNNIMIDCDEAVLIGSTPTGTNIYKGNIRRNGSWWSEFNTSDNLIATADLTEESEGLQRLVENSEAIAFAKAISNFTPTSDVFGGTRDANPDSGAEEFGASGMKRPYTLEDVGVLIGALPEENTTGIKDLGNSTIKVEIYPNPIDNFMVINADYEINQIKIYDLTGKIVKSKVENSLQKQITYDVSEINKGIYILEVTLKNETKVSKRIVIN